jgi:hypothetical protein
MALVPIMGLPGDAVVIWTALQNSAVHTWARDHGAYGVHCDPLAIETELQADGSAVCECKACACGVVIGRNGDRLMSWADALPPGRARR